MSTLPTRERWTSRTSSALPVRTATAMTMVAMAVARVRMSRRARSPVAAGAGGSGSRRLIQRGLLQAVAGAPDGLELVRAERLVELSAQISHVDLNDVGVAGDVGVPHLLDDLTAADH